VTHAAEVNIKDKEGKTPLHEAAYKGHLKTVQWLVTEAGADTAATDNNGNTAMELAKNQTNTMYRDAALAVAEWLQKYKK
jgi:cytohesin